MIAIMHNMVATTVINNQKLTSKNLLIEQSDTLIEQSP